MQKGIKKILALEKGRKMNALMVEQHNLQQLFWECTLKCNLKCRHCGSDCKADDRRNDMPLEDFIPVLDEIKQQTDLPVLVITTGGEPLLRKDILECGKDIKERGFYWGMVSNGTYLNAEVLKRLLEIGLDSLSISLDGLCDEHNWMRQSSSSFDDAINAIDIVAKTLSDLTWDVISCINKKNVSQLEEIKQLLIEHDVKQWKIFTVFPMGRASGDSELQLNRDEFMRLMDFIVEARKDGSIKVSYGCESFLGSYEYEVRDQLYFCAAGVNVASILHDGSISGCLSIRYNYKEGNIYKDSFMDVWNNRFQRYRNRSWMKTGLCENCEVWRWCEGNGMHLRDNDGNLLLCNYNKLFKGITSYYSL